VALVVAVAALVVVKAAALVVVSNCALSMQTLFHCQIVFHIFYWL
jgi:hypothetical protein